MLSLLEIRSLQERYRLLGDDLPAVLLAHENLSQDRDAVQWVEKAARFAAAHTIRETEASPLFSSAFSETKPFALLFVLLERTADAVREYRARGFSEKEISEALSEYARSIAITEKRTGRPGLDRTQFFWLLRFAKTRAFFCGGLIFELCPFHSYAVVLQNSVSGETAVFRQPSSACIDEILAALAARNGEADSKWEIALRPGDMALSLHIPQGAELSKDTAANAAESALAKAAACYPEHSVRGIYCVSWMLNPCLDALLPERSRIRGFASAFVRYPAKNTCDAAFDFVFPERVNPERLPEDTSLRRALKKVYLAGDRVPAYAGILRLAKENDPV